VVRDLLEQVSGYPGLFFMCSLSGLLVPVPEDVALLYAGLRVGSGAFGWGPALIIAMIGVFIRDVLAFGIGRLVGDKVLSRPSLRRMLGERRLARASSMVERNATTSVLFGRGFIGFRTPVFFVAGASGVSLRRFALVDALGILVTVPAVVIVGYAFGEPMLDVGLQLMRSTRWLAVGFTLLALLWLARQRGEEHEA